VAEAFELADEAVAIALGVAAVEVVRAEAFVGNAAAR
jgi:hypothetical protein